MITAAASATINRIPVLLLPGDYFSKRTASPLLQQTEYAFTQDMSANDCFKPVSKYWDRINRPEQLISSMLEAMRVLTSPSETGAVTIALPHDVQAETYEFPDQFFQKRNMRIIILFLMRSTLACSKIHRAAFNAGRIARENVAVSMYASPAAADLAAPK